MGLDRDDRHWGRCTAVRGSHGHLVRAIVGDIVDGHHGELHRTGSRATDGPVFAGGRIGGGLGEDGIECVNDDGCC